jgi:hypothetical protein
VLSYSAGNSTGNLQLLYNNNGAGLAANVTPFFGISVPLLNLDLGNAPQLDVTATLNDGTNSASDTVTVTTSGGQNLLIPPGAFAGLDLTNLQSILIQFFAGPDTEFDVGAIRILTPEPLALLGWTVVLLVGFAGWRCVASRVRAG